MTGPDNLCLMLRFESKLKLVDTTHMGNMWAYDAVL